MTTDITLDGVALSTAVPAAKVLDVRRPLLGTRRHVDIDVPGRAGPWRFDEQPGARRLELDVDIEADTFADRVAAIEALADWVDVGTAELIIDDTPDRYWSAIINNEVKVVERLRAGAATLEFTVDPYTVAVSSSSTGATATGGSDSDTWNITDGLEAEPVVTLTAVGGTLTGFTLTIAGRSLTWSPGTIVTAGNSITISSISDTVTQGVNDDVNLTGAYDAAAVDMADVVGTFPILEPGANAWSLTYTGTATSIIIAVVWRERFRR